MRVRTELGALREAASGQEWPTVAASIEVLAALIAELPPEDIALADALLGEARQTIDEIIPLVAHERDFKADELRLLAVGRKAIKAYR